MSSFKIMHCKFKSVSLALLFLILFTSLFNALPTGCDVVTKLDFGNQSSTTAVEQNWKTFSFIGLLASTALLTIIYMIGKAIDNPSLLSRAKTDMVQVIVTAIILILFYGILSTICLFDAREFGFGFSSYFEGAKDYFEYARNTALYSYLVSTNAIMTLSGLSSFSVNAPNFITLGALIKLGLFTKVYIGYQIALGALSWFSSLVMLSISLMKGYLVVLNAIELYFLNLILPAGVVLRCFTPTRDFGGVLIALSLGLFIFYPLLFSFSYMILSSPDPNVSYPSMDWENKIYTKAFVIGTVSALPFGTMAAIIDGLNDSGEEASDMLFEAFGSVGKTLLPVFILPAINWIILIAIIRDLSRALGQEIDISGLARMI